MGPAIIARNYAETLLDLARRHGGEATVDEYAAALDEVAAMLRREPRVREFLETPRVDTAAKQAAVRAAFAGRVPELFLRFLLVVVEKRRQGLLPEIADEFQALVDAARNRVRAVVATALPADAELQGEIVAALGRKLGKTVVARFETDPALLGGARIRVGDQVLDGSLRYRMEGLRRRMLRSRLHAAAV